ncbi:MAG TPA: hypothetical protein PKI00_01410 [Candidatus Pacearchaeota archaeon]|nr:hypothetical protein [Candidatus Pacearchaeota archaeon]
MNKKVKIALSILLLILISVFIIYKIFEFNKEKEENLNFITINDFIERKMDNKTIIENQEIGLSFVLPQGWEFVNTNWANVSMRTFDYEPFMGEEERLPLLNKGCWIDFNFSKNSMNGFDYNLVYNLAHTEGFAEGQSTEKDKYERIEINGKKAVKSTLILDNNLGEIISIQIPFDKNKVYNFDTYLTSQDKENCSETFNSFINSISIK